jgi:sarcosine oxidase
MKEYDVVVVGLGIMGTSALFHAARSGAKVLGIEAFGQAHRYGSSYGETRIFRRAYWEGEKYLPLLNRAHDLWMELQEMANEQLIVRTGGIFIGPQATGMVAGSRRTAEAGAVPHEVLDAAQIRKRFPAFRVADHMEGIYEPGAAVIMAEKSRMCMMNLAIESGAEIHFEKLVQGIKDSGVSGLLVETADGEQFRAGSVVVTTGPWIARDLLPELGRHISSNKVPIYWFDVRSGKERDFAKSSFPAFLYEHPSGSLLYGIPNQVSAERGVKIGFHNQQQAISDPDILDRSVDGLHLQEISQFVELLFPGLNPDPISSRSCFYTMSSDESFLIGASKKTPNIFYASACSGHGFKFGTAIGESLSLLAQGKEPPTDLTAFGASRFNVDAGDASGHGQHWSSGPGQCR